MPAQVEVLDGPDRGWKYVVVAEEARIGRGACGIPLSDRAWPDGTLAIQRRHGGYLVANHLPHPVYLDGQPLAPNGVQTLHHGALLQPTAGTRLRLAIVDTPDATPPMNGVIALPPVKPRRRFTATRILTAVIFIAGLVGWQWNEQRVAAEARHALHEAAVVHKLAMYDTVRDEKLDPSLTAKTRQAWLTLTDAFYLEVKGDTTKAHQEYCEARDLIETLAPRVPTERRTDWQAALSFTRDRITATAR